MCFSPLASFTTAGFTGAIGLIAVSRASRPSDLPLAAVPAVYLAPPAPEGGRRPDGERSPFCGFRQWPGTA